MRKGKHSFIHGESHGNFYISSPEHPEGFLMYAARIGRNFGPQEYRVNDACVVIFLSALDAFNKGDKAAFAGKVVFIDTIITKAYLLALVFLVWPLVYQAFRVVYIAIIGIAPSELWF